MCQQRAEYVVPCSTQSQCPDPWSAPLRCAHWMPILGDPGAHEMGVPSRNGDPREHNWEALPHPRQEPNPAPRHPGSPRPCRTPSAFPAAVGTPESTTVTTPHPLPTGTPTRAARVRPTPVPARCPPSPGAPGEPRAHSRFQERLWLLPPVQTGGQYIHPTGTIQAVYDLGIKRGLQQGKVT